MSPIEAGCVGAAVVSVGAAVVVSVGAAVVSVGAFVVVSFGASVVSFLDSLVSFFFFVVSGVSSEGSTSEGSLVVEAVASGSSVSEVSELSSEGSLVSVVVASVVVVVVSSVVISEELSLLLGSLSGESPLSSFSNGLPFSAMFSKSVCSVSGWGLNQVEVSRNSSLMSDMPKAPSANADAIERTVIFFDITLAKCCSFIRLSPKIRCFPKHYTTIDTNYSIPIWQKTYANISNL